MILFLFIYNHSKQIHGSTISDLCCYITIQEYNSTKYLYHALNHKILSTQCHQYNLPPLFNNWISPNISLTV